jgi:transposase-like protein
MQSISYARHQFPPPVIQQVVWLYLRFTLSGTVKSALAWISGTGYRVGMRTPTDRRYAGYRFPAEVIATAVWLYFRFPLNLRMVEEMLAARGIGVSHETVRQ